MLWILIPVLTFGLAAPVPAAHAALKLRRRGTTAAAMFVTSLTVTSYVLVSLHPRNHSSLSVTTGMFLIGSAMAGAIIAAAYRQEVFPSPAQNPHLLPPLARDQSVIAAKSRTRRRLEAAQLAKREPSLAADLGIGRPDAHKDFDDGGLIDINHVSTATLISALSLAPELAEKVAKVRDRLGRFDGPDDLVTFGCLPEELVDSLRDRLIAL